MGLIPGRVGFAFCLVSLYNLMVGVKDRVQAEAYIQTGKIMVLDYKIDSLIKSHIKVGSDRSYIRPFFLVSKCNSRLFLMRKLKTLGLDS